MRDMPVGKAETPEANVSRRERTSPVIMRTRAGKDGSGAGGNIGG